MLQKTEARKKYKECIKYSIALLVSKNDDASVLKEKANTSLK